MPITYQSPDRDRFSGIKVTSRYLTMRDGVRLAVDVYFPEPYDFRQPLPVLLHQTRYWRRTRFKWPYRWFMSPFQGSAGRLVKEIVLSGYVLVNVDARGSGASFGSRVYPWMPDEVDDGVEIVDWIIQQPWSNGNVGAVGISYTGTAAEYLATRNHPAVKAYMPLFSLYDIYTDIALPGGIPHDGFISRWGRANALLDANQNPLPYPIAKLLIQGVAPVKGHESELSRALEAHEDNLNVDETSKGIMFRGQTPGGGGAVQIVDDMSIGPIQGNYESGAFLSGSGWYDGAYQLSAIKRFRNLDLPYNKLVIGAWSHGGKWHTSPGYSGPNQDDLPALATHYFDHFLKGYDTPATDTPRVQYFTMQEEKWKTADQWPPKGTEMVPLWLDKGQKLVTKAPASRGVDVLQHDPTSGTGELTRWRALAGLVPTHKYYPDRREQTRPLLHYQTAPLSADAEVTGHPILELWIQTRESDGSIFIYLDDVLPNGDLRYVTEGLLRASHCKESDAPDPMQGIVPVRSFKEADSAPLPAGEPTLLRIDLLPTSYLFRAGHAIRLTLATADKDNFADLNREGSEYGILWGERQGGRLLLPVGAK